MKDRQRGQSFLEGAAILTGATLIVKVIGAFFKIPLANILGGVGMSYFVTAYDLFTPIYSLTVTGLGVAVSRMVAEQTAHGNRLGAEAVLQASRRIFWVIGLVGAVVILALAPWFVGLVGNSAALFAVVAIAPAVVFSCVSSIYRGYYQGLSNMVPTAISQVVESVVRLVLGVGFAYGATLLLARQYQETGELFGFAFTSAQYANQFILRFAAAGAILGVTASTAAGALYIRLGFGRVARCKERPTPQLVRDTGRRLVAVAVPIALSTLVVNLSALIDLTSVMNCLHVAIGRDSAALLSMYPGGIPPTVSLDLLPEYLYGSYSGLAYPVFNLIPSITAALGVSAIPAVSRAWAKGGQNLQQTVSSILRLTMLVALPAGLGIGVLAEPILLFLYPARAMEVSIVAPILRVMGYSAVLVAAATPINSILQAIGREKLPLFILLLGAAVKLATNLILIPRPEVNIQGVPYGTLFCYGLIVILSATALRLTTGVRLGLWGTVVKPFLCALGSSLSAAVVYRVFPGGNTLRLMAAIAFAVLIYTLLVLFSGTILKNDVKMLPIKENVVKRLEKLGFIS